MFREIPLLLLIGGMIKASRNISVSLGDLKQPEDCQDFLTRFEVNLWLQQLLSLNSKMRGRSCFPLPDFITEIEVEICFGQRGTFYTSVAAFVPSLRQLSTDQLFYNQYHFLCSQ